MKKILYLFVAFFIAGTIPAQTIKIHTGVSFSSLQIENTIINYDTRNDFVNITKGYSIFLGIDYIETKYFNLSSNIGFIEKGGRGLFRDANLDTVPIDVSINYFSINTLINLKYPLTENISPFIAFGERLDYVSDYPSELHDYMKNTGEKVLPGLLLGGGFRYDLPEFRFEIYYLFYQNVKEAAEFDNYRHRGTLDDQTSTLNLSFGFKI